jgi:hypothetical protein
VHHVQDGHDQEDLHVLDAHVQEEGHHGRENRPFRVQALAFLYHRQALVQAYLYHPWGPPWELFLASYPGE